MLLQAGSGHGYHSRYIIVFCVSCYFSFLNFLDEIVGGNLLTLTKCFSGIFYCNRHLLLSISQAGKLNTYRFCDNVWTFMLNDVEFREVQEIARVSKVKVVACDGKGE